jgi:hypothetical protein
MIKKLKKLLTEHNIDCNNFTIENNGETLDIIKDNKIICRFTSILINTYENQSQLTEQQNNIMKKAVQYNLDNIKKNNL